MDESRIANLCALSRKPDQVIINPYIYGGGGDGGSEVLGFDTGDTDIPAFDEYLGYIFPSVAAGFIAPATGTVVRAEALLINDTDSILDFSAQLAADLDADDAPDTFIGSGATFSAASVPDSYGYVSLTVGASIVIGEKYWLTITQTTPGFGDPYIRWLLGTIGTGPLSNAYIAGGGPRYSGAYRPQFRLYLST